MVMDSTGYERRWIAPMVLELPLYLMENKIELDEGDEISCKRLSRGPKDGAVGDVSEHSRYAHLDGKVGDEVFCKAGSKKVE